ncbi:MAG: cyclic nucleotide-binding domain-containing protein [Treponema sp.]|nr:cyclic nucleotide-binding domain-containing protein [Treponema sp.]
MGTPNIDLASIQETELFSNLKKDEIDFIVSHSGSLSLPKNKLLFKSGEKASQFYILTSGEIRVFNKNEDDSEEEMARYRAGDTIGDFDFARSAVYDAYAEAAEDSQLIVFPASGCTMDSLVQKDPKSICSIMLNAIVMMTGRIKSTHKLVLDNMSWVQELHRRAYEDPGTGLWKQILITDEIINVLEDPAALIMIKPDRFKILVDSNGHSAGDEAMIRIAVILKNITRHFGHGWALRFKSNEVGMIFNNFGSSQAELISKEIANAIQAMEPVQLKVPADNGENPLFHFSATVSWAVWPEDNPEWEEFFFGNYGSLLDNWRDGGKRVVHYTKAEEES